MIVFIVENIGFHTQRWVREILYFTFTSPSSRFSPVPRKQKSRNFMQWKLVFIETTYYINNRWHYCWVPHNSHFNHLSTQYYFQKFNSVERNRCLLPNRYSFLSDILLFRWPLQVVACSTDIPRQLLVKLHPLSLSFPATARNKT